MLYWDLGKDAWPLMTLTGSAEAGYLSAHAQRPIVRGAEVLLEKADS